MPRYKAAHVNHQGQDMILFPVDGSFGAKSAEEQAYVLNVLTARANAAGLAGRAVVFWEALGIPYFMGPVPMHPYLRSLSLRDVWAKVNKELSWST